MFCRKSRSAAAAAVHAVWPWRKEGQTNAVVVPMDTMAMMTRDPTVTKKKIGLPISAR